MLQKSYVKSALHGLGSGLGLTLLKITNQRDTAWNAPRSHCGRERWGGRTNMGLNQRNTQSLKDRVI